MVTPTILQLLCQSILNKNIMLCPECILWLFFIIKWSKLGSYLHNTNLGSFLVEIWEFDPEGDHLSRHPLPCFAIILKQCHHALSWSICCGYFALSNGTNWDGIWIIPIFVVFYWPKCGYLTPQGDHIYDYPPVLQLILKRNVIMCCPVHSSYKLNKLMWC